MKKPENILTLALAKSRKFYNQVSPNPPVGAVIVKDNKIISVSAHMEYGGAHAEVNALKKLSNSEKENSELYVTLEPCNHTERLLPAQKLLLNLRLKKYSLVKKTR